MILILGRNKNFSVLEEVATDGRKHQVYPLDKKYLKNSGDQTDKLDHSLYSLNVLNLEGIFVYYFFNLVVDYLNYREIANCRRFIVQQFQQSLQPS